MSENGKPAAHTPRKDSDVWHGLKDHLDCVAAKARHNAAKFGAGELGYYAGLWHDLSKYTHVIQGANLLLRSLIFSPTEFISTLISKKQNFALFQMHQSPHYKIHLTKC